MAVLASQITLGTTGATAVVAPSTVAYPNQSVARSGHWRTVTINCTGAIFLGGNATGTSVTMAPIAAGSTVTMPLAPDEGIYGLGVAASVVGVLITGG